MRTARLIGLAALSALAAMACLGSSAASAATLCSVKENPCPGAFEYKAGTKIEATLAAGTKATFTTSLGTVICLSSTFGGETTSAGGKEKAVEAKVGTLTFASCKLAEIACTLTAVHLPYSAPITALGGVEALTLEHSEGVGASAKCGTFVNCTYTAKRVELKMAGGNPATLTVNGLPLEGVGAFCGTKPTFTAKYEVPQPKPAFVVAQAPAERSFAVEEGYGRGNPGEPNVLRSWTGPSVNAATGNLVEGQTDLVLGGRGPTLEVTRTYNSLLAAAQEKPGPFGYGWTGSFGAYLTVDEKAATATVHQDDGSAVVFYLVEGKYFPAKWVQATLAKKGTSYVYTLPSQLTLEFSASGQLVKETDRHGNAITLVYNAKSQLETATDAAGRKLTFTYNAGGQVESVKDPMGHLAKYTYESSNLATVSLPEEKLRWKFGYNASHQMTGLTDGRGHTTTFEYDASKRVKLEKDALERKRTIEYPSGTETKITEPNASATVETFSSAGEPTAVTRASGTAIAAKTTSEYDSSFNLKATTDPNTHTTKFGYDAEGNKTSETDANNNESKWTYNSTHDIATMTTPKVEVTTFTRNAAGDPETIKRPAPGATTQEFKFKWAANGDLEEETDPLGHVTKFEYDSFGDRKAQIDPEEDKTTRTFDEDGQKISEVSPRGNEAGAKASEFETKTERDAQERPIKITDPLGHETKYKYDADGNLEVQTNPNGHATTDVYDNDDELTEVKAANGNVRKTAYDSMGEVKSETDGNNHTTKYERNALEQVTEEIDPLERKTTRTYDAAGNLKELKDAEGRTTTYTYDPGDRLKEVSYSDGLTKAVSYEYGKDGEVTVMKDATGTTTNTYDELDRLTETKNGNAEVVKYEYNLGDQITKITYPNAKSITRGFDKAGRLEKVTDWLGKETKFAYNRDSLPKTTTFPAASTNKDEYEYNTADQLVKTTMLQGAVTLASITNTRDSAGQLKTATQKGLPGAEKPEYGYDEKERMTSGAGSAFEYDPANNTTKVAATTYSYDAASQLKEGGGTKYAFNKVGQRTTMTPEKGPATTYGWDQAGNMISVTRKAEGEIKEIKDTFTDDGNGLRASETINGTTTHMAWDAAEALPLLLFDGTNYYLYGPEGLPFEQIASETATYLHHDQQGSTRLLTNASGETKGSYTYTPYGATETHTGTASTRLGYDAQYTNSDTGLIYLRKRVLDPTPPAQFMSRDPQEAETGEAYAYAEGNPVNTGDPSGEQVRTPRPSGVPNAPQPQPQPPPAGGGISMTPPGYGFNPYTGIGWVTPGEISDPRGISMTIPGYAFNIYSGAWEVGAGRIAMAGGPVMITPAYGYNPVTGFYGTPGSIVTPDGISMIPPGYTYNATGEYHVSAGVIVTPTTTIITPAYGYHPVTGFYVTPGSITTR
jgi:RHS repeat-associated protein